MFDQIRVDHGKEFYLTLYGQEKLAHLRTNPNRDPHRQTESKKVIINNFGPVPLGLILRGIGIYQGVCILTGA